MLTAAYGTLQGACVIDYVGRDQMAPGVGLLSIAMGFGRLTAMLVSGRKITIPMIEIHKIRTT